jgi:MFS family permease
LTVRNYRLFTSGQIVKLLGTWMQITAQDWLVLELSNNSPSALGYVTALQFAPVLLLTLFAGRLADRYDKRLLLIWVNVAFVIFTVGLSTLVATGAVTLGYVYLFAALVGLASAIETPVRQSFVSELVPRELLPNALGLSAATFNTARIAGPALAGVVIGLLGLTPVFLLNIVTAVSPTVALIRMRPAELFREKVVERAEASIIDGLRYVSRRDDLLLPISLIFVVSLIGMNFGLTLPALAKIVFQVDATRFGLLTTFLALGALCGAMASSTRRRRPGAFTVIGAATLFGLLETIVGFAPSFWTTAALLAPTGFCMVFFAQAGNQRVQLGTDAAYRGRVMSLWVLVFMGTAPIGALLIGWLADHFGPGASIWLGGLVSLAAGLTALVWQLRRSGARLSLQMTPLPRLYVVAAKAPDPL